MADPAAIPPACQHAFGIVIHNFACSFGARPWSCNCVPAHQCDDCAEDVPIDRVWDTSPHVARQGSKWAVWNSPAFHRATTYDAALPFGPADGVDTRPRLALIQGGIDG